MEKVHVREANALAQNLQQLLTRCYKLLVRRATANFIILGKMLAFALLYNKSLYDDCIPLLINS